MVIRPEFRPNRPVLTLTGAARMEDDSGVILDFAPIPFCYKQTSQGLPLISHELGRKPLAGWQCWLWRCARLGMRQPTARLWARSRHGAERGEALCSGTVGED